MAGERTQITIQAFRTGSWQGHILEDFDSSAHFTVSKIVRSMEVFSKKYKVETTVLPHYTLLLWELRLEERETRKKQVKRKMKSGEEKPSTSDTEAKQRRVGLRKRSAKEESPTSVTEDITMLPKVFTLKLALSVEDSLLFSSKHISLANRKFLQSAFNCRQLTTLDLGNSDPVNLLRFYNQAAKMQPGHLLLQNEEYLACLREQIVDRALWSDKEIGIETEKVAQLHKKLGSQHDQIPCIKKLTLCVADQPIMSEVPALAGFRISEVVAEIHAPSVFHLYTEMGEAGVLEKVPVWLDKARRSGKNIVSARYQ